MLERHGDIASPEYRAWRDMRQRCLNSRSVKYPDYGGRGITIDPKWDSYEVFLADMGRRPSPAHSLERTDNDSGYGPGNCIWGTKAQQSQNRRGVKLSTERVAELRRRLQSGERAVDIAPEFGIHVVHARQIKRGAKWTSSL